MAQDTTNPLHVQGFGGGGAMVDMINVYHLNSQFPACVLVMTDEHLLGGKGKGEGEGGEGEGDLIHICTHRHTVCANVALMLVQYCLIVTIWYHKT